MKIKIKNILDVITSEPKCDKKIVMCTSDETILKRQLIKQNIKVHQHSDIFFNFKIDSIDYEIRIDDNEPSLMIEKTVNKWKNLLW